MAWIGGEIIKTVSDENQYAIWGGSQYYRIFISHKKENKAEASELKKQLKYLGISCFVAHDDIRPLKDWQEEILNALFSADALVATMTDGFYESDWTDQEIGCAVGLNIPIYAVRMGADPHGFIGRFQALNSSWENLPENFVKLIVKNPKFKYSLVAAVEQFDTYSSGKLLRSALEMMNECSEDMIDRLLFAYNTNFRLQQCYSFRDKKFLTIINRISKRKFTENDGKITLLFG